MRGKKREEVLNSSTLNPVHPALREQGTRKELLLEAAESEANEVQALLVHFKALPTTRDRMAQLGNDDEQSVDRMLRSVWEQSLATLHSLRKRPQVLRDSGHALRPASVFPNAACR